MTRWQIAMLELLGVYAIARISELVTSKLRLRETAAVHEPWWPAMVMTHAAVLVGSASVALAKIQMPPLPWVLLPLLGLMVATALRLWMLFTLGSRWNVRITMPPTIATDGPYRFIRHPNYLAVILEIAALPMLVGAYWLALIGSALNAMILSWRIPLEERLLCARHEQYRTVMMARPRFVPGAKDIRREIQEHET